MGLWCFDTCYCTVVPTCTASSISSEFVRMLSTKYNNSGKIRRTCTGRRRLGTPTELGVCTHTLHTDQWHRDVLLYSNIVHIIFHLHACILRSEKKVIYDIWCIIHAGIWVCFSFYWQTYMNIEVAALSTVVTFKTDEYMYGATYFQYIWIYDRVKKWTHQYKLIT